MFDREIIEAAKRDAAARRRIARRYGRDWEARLERATAGLSLAVVATEERTMRRVEALRRYARKYHARKNG